MTMLSATIRSQASESPGEAIYRPCEVIIPASRRVSSPNEFLDKVTTGLRNTQLPTTGYRQHGEHYGVP
jgi:hypothetical protein